MPKDHTTKENSIVAKRLSVENVEKFLKKKGWGPSDLAREGKITYPYVYRVMRKEGGAGIKFIHACLDVGMSLEELFPNGNSDS